MSVVLAFVLANKALLALLGLAVLEQILPHVGNPKINSTLQLLVPALRRLSNPAEAAQ